MKVRNDSGGAVLVCGTILRPQSSMAFPDRVWKDWIKAASGNRLLAKTRLTILERCKPKPKRKKKEEAGGGD